MQKVVCQTRSKEKREMRSGSEDASVELDFDELSLPPCENRAALLTEKSSHQSPPDEATQRISPKRTEKCRSDETQSERERKVVFVLESNDCKNERRAKVQLQRFDD